MKIKPDDPRLTAYTLGELNPADRQLIEAALENSAECRHALQEITATTELLTAALASEPLPTLSPARQQKIAAQLISHSPTSMPATKNPHPARTPTTSFQKATRLAAVLALFFTAFLAVHWFSTHPEKKLQPQPLPIAHIENKAEPVVPNTSDAAFEQWAAPYRQLQIPLVSIEEAAHYTPPKILPIGPISGQYE